MGYLSCVFLIFTSVSLVLTSPASPASLNSALLASANSKQGNNGLGASPPECNFTQYGSNVRLQSSLNALAKIPQDPARTTFEMREQGQEPGWFTVLPQGFISDDGKDFINVATKDNSQVSDTSSWREIQSAANSIIQTCVSQPNPLGGMVTDVGVEGLLTVTVSSYDNRYVSCIDPATVQQRSPARYESCKSVLNSMPWSENLITFGAAPSPITHVERLPKIYASPDRQCFLQIVIVAPGYEIASYKSLWAAGVASLEMCTKQGLHSYVKLLGVHHKMAILWKGPEREVGSLGTSLVNLTSGTVVNNLTLY